MKRIFKIFLKIAAILLSLAAILFLGLYLKYNTSLPKGERGEKADQLAYNISKAIGYEAFQNTDFISWESIGYYYLWNRKAKTVDIKWDENHVLYNKDTPNKSVVISPKKTPLSKQKELIAKAGSRFNNDSFWLVAPFKLFDQGAERKYIEATENQNASLLITYTSGGTTPGDSYQWFVDDNFIPTHYKMWVKIIPIGGIPATWTSWKKTDTGVLLSNEKKILGKLTLPMKEIKTWNNK